MTETNVRVLFPEEVSVGQQQEMLSHYRLAVHNARGELRGPSFHIAVQDLELNTLHFGQGRTYNEALMGACNHALRARDEQLRKSA